MRNIMSAAAVAFFVSGTAATAQAQQNPAMTFFVTGVGLGKGADLGGLAGADKHCQMLSETVGAGGKTWRAYLSAQATAKTPAVNARDRIGRGPWRNANGEIIAASVADLHGPNNNLTKATALTEKGATIYGRGDQPNTHDVLTGSKPDGRAFPRGKDMTCSNWTDGGPNGAAMVGHHDRRGLDEKPPAKSWNSSHPSRGGCGQDALKSTGGAGLFYCFATN